MVKLVITALMLFLGGCSPSHRPDHALAENVRQVLFKNASPAVLDGRTAELIEQSTVYAKLLSGYIGAPPDFDLMLSLGNVNYSWQRYTEAEAFYKRVMRPPRLAAHIMICNAVIVGTPERVRNIDEAPMINPDVLRALSDRTPSALFSAVDELRGKAATADIRVTMIYANMIAALATWIEDVDTATERLLHDYIFVPAWLELLEGVSFAQFAETIRQGDQSFRQTVIMNDAVSIIAHASDFWEDRGQVEDAVDWVARRDRLLSLLVDERVITNAWAENVKQNKALDPTRVSRPTIGKATED